MNVILSTSITDDFNDLKKIDPSVKRNNEIMRRKILMEIKPLQNQWFVRRCW